MAEKKLVYKGPKGVRWDGRMPEDLREIKIKTGVIPRADGSCYLEWGYNKVIASCYGPRECLPKHSSNPYQAVVKFNYRMAGFSVSDRKNPRPGRREMEISKVSADALTKAIMVERFPNTQIDVFVEILDSNAGTRIAGLTAAACACADAGLPMRDLVAGTAVGRAGGQVIVDLNKEEEDAPDAVDGALAILPNSGEIVLLQMDGKVTVKEWKEMLSKGIDGCQKVYKIQKEALKEKYKGDSK